MDILALSAASISISMNTASKLGRGGGGPKVQRLCRFFVVLLCVYSQWGLEKTKQNPAGRKTARIVSQRGALRTSRTVFVRCMYSVMYGFMYGFVYGVCTVHGATYGATYGLKNAKRTRVSGKKRTGFR
jgi:TctA family transporter